MIQAKENRPGTATGAIPRSTSHSATADAPESTGAPRIPHLTAAEITASSPAYALLVKSPAGRVNRRLYLSLAAAVKATERAQQRGRSVSLELVRLVPYTVGAELHGAVSADA